MGFRRFGKNELNPDEVRMTLGEHLEELRSRLIRAIVALALGAIACYVFIDPIQGFLGAAVFAVLRNHHLPTDMYVFGPTEQLMLEIKLALIIGFILTAPYSLVQLWGFVAAGLYPHERKWVRRFVPVSIVLFFVGVIFFVVIVNPLFLEFLINYSTKELPDMERYLPSFLRSEDSRSTTTRPFETWPTTQPELSRIPPFSNDPRNPPEGYCWLNRTAHEIRVRYGEQTYALRLQEVGRHNRILPTIRVTEYMMLVLQTAAAFGLGFQVPVVVALLSTIGIVSAAQMTGVRKYVWFVIAIVAAVVTPSPDVASMMLLCVPMVLLFEAGLVAARFIERERGPKEA